MIITINESSDMPIYLQIRNQIVQGISDGRLRPGEQLPTVRALAAEIGINSMTVSKAYQSLKQEGYILADRRSGARVRESFSKQNVLSDHQLIVLKQIISEAKISGMSKEAFLKECEHLYQEGESV
uniref:GntR family transcriptional regulator n=1 Tax=Acetatifactor sp. TaxID=1872090 RepID=UPI004057128A